MSWNRLRRHAECMDVSRSVVAKAEGLYIISGPAVWHQSPPMAGQMSDSVLFMAGASDNKFSANDCWTNMNYERATAFTRALPCFFSMLHLFKLLINCMLKNWDLCAGPSECIKSAIAEWRSARLRWFCEFVARVELGSVSLMKKIFAPSMNWNSNVTASTECPGH